MLGSLLLIPLLVALTAVLIPFFARRNKAFSPSIGWGLFWYHVLFWLIYYGYTLSARSDSKRYFTITDESYDSWSATYTTGTGFVNFVAYPFVKLGFTYEMMMLLFAWFGYIGFLYFYAFFKENLVFKHKYQKTDLVNILLFLPNMHFWTASLGKGSLIFLGLGMAIYSLSRLNKRKVSLFLGLLLIYHVRPHVFLFVLLGIVVGLFTGKQKVKTWQKYTVILAASLALVFMYENIIAFVGLDSENVLESFDTFSSTRSKELARTAGSGVDTSNYPLLLKLVTFWFRPLFFDAPGLLGLFVSLENLFYIIVSWNLLNRRFIPFLIKGPALMKTSLVIFVVASVALSTTMSNLGIIIRQKSQVMYFFFFTVLMFLDWKRMQEYKEKAAALMKREAKKNLTNLHGDSAATAKI